MAEALKLSCILAHPDDESLGAGGTLARYAREGVETHLVTATRGQRGWFGERERNPGPMVLGRIREAELRSAAAALGLRSVEVLDYCDGELDQADPDEVISRLVAHLRRIRPQVVVTFGPDGVYGHPDHIAISQLATAAVIRAAIPECATSALPPHVVSKLYYMVVTAEQLRRYESVFGGLTMSVDGVERSAVGWPDWTITTRLDVPELWSTVWKAVSCHQTQLPTFSSLTRLTPEEHQQLWGRQTYYRAFSLVGIGRTVEDDLFAGLRGISGLRED